MLAIVIINLTSVLNRNEIDTLVYVERTTIDSRNAGKGRDFQAAADAHISYELYKVGKNSKIRP